MGKRLSPREQKFVAAYLVHGKQRQAAVEAGYAPSSASQSASRLMKQPRIKEKLTALAKAQLSPEYGVTKSGILALTADIAKDKGIDVNARLKALTLLSKLQGYFLTPMEVLLGMPQDELLAVIDKARETIEVNHETISNE